MANVQDVLNSATAFIAAAGGLGTAAYGLVDASKAFRGGVSVAGFKAIRSRIGPLIQDAGGIGAYNHDDVMEMLRANWLNGVAKPDQKAAAKSLIRLCLTPENAQRMATAVGVDPAVLASVTQKITNGEELTKPELGVLGRFDTIISAVLDEAYERADQQYRNFAKFWASVVAIALAVVGGGIIHYSFAPSPTGAYVFSGNFLVAILVGALSTPIAPVGKDLASAIASAVSAVGAWRR